MKVLSLMTMLAALPLCTCPVLGQTENDSVIKGCTSKAMAVDFVTTYNTAAAKSFARSGLRPMPTKEEMDEIIVKDLEDMSRYYRIVDRLEDCPGGKFVAPQKR